MASFTVTVPDIHQGTGMLWYGVAAPAPGARLLVDANGNPLGGSPLPMGSSDGAATFHMEAKVEEVAIDQQTAPVAAVMTAESAYLEVTLKESALTKIAAGLAHATYSSGTDAGLPAGAQNYEEITVGGLVTIPQAAVALISPRRGFNSPGKFMVACLYNAYAKDPFQIGFTRAKEAVYKVRFDGLAVLSRSPGDQVAQFYRQI
ncbi:MAG TPA: hypothetical protein VG860_15890 [Terriglobia bacterium]|jgi:hypothetical protein|nr:hypothetical protein [Terriglobia bacterium]